MFNCAKLQIPRVDYHIILSFLLCLLNIVITIVTWFIMRCGMSRIWFTDCLLIMLIRVFVLNFDTCDCSHVLIWRVEFCFRNCRVSDWSIRDSILVSCHTVNFSAVWCGQKISSVISIKVTRKKKKKKPNPFGHIFGWFGIN